MGSQPMKANTRGKFRWKKAAIIVTLVIALLVAADLAAASWLAPYAQRRLLEAMGERFESGLEIRRMELTLFPGVYASADDVVVYHFDRRDWPPLMKIRHVSCDAGIIGILTGP